MSSLVMQLDETQKVAVLAEKYLQKYQPEDYRIVVRPAAVHRGSGRWLVQVDHEPRDKTISGEDFIDRICKANEDIDRDFPRYIRLTQAVPQPGEVL